MISQNRKHIIVKYFDLVPTERFHSRDYLPYWFTETKETICIKIEFNSQRFSLGHQHGVVTSCENTLDAWFYGRRWITSLSFCSFFAVISKKMKQIKSIF